METIKAIYLNQYWLKIFISCFFFLIGYHAGNRFRINRLKIRSTEEIQDKINLLKKQKLECYRRIAQNRDHWNTNDATMLKLQDEITLLTSQINSLEWVYSNKN